MCEALLELMQEELEEREIEGAHKKLQEIINKKLRKGKSVEQIAEDLEEEIDVIEKIVATMEVPRE